MPAIPVTRSSVRLLADPRRAITKPFLRGYERIGDSRVEQVVARVLAMSDADVTTTLRTTRHRFEGRHADLGSVLEAAYDEVSAGKSRPEGGVSKERRLLTGAYLTHEYTFEAAALTNPSMVLAPDQTGLAPGARRFILSLRSIGEGHISSIQFRSGVIDAHGRIEVDHAGPHPQTARHLPPKYDKHTFRCKMRDLHADNEVGATVLASLGDEFTLKQLDAALRDVEERHAGTAETASTTRTIHWLAASNYRCAFAPDSDLSERILFPSSPTESQGMEDARFVRFTREDGSHTYFASYTAYDGRHILPQLIETAEFVSFHIASLNGVCAKNKGLALFPRRVDGRYLALGRLDNQNNFLLRSDNVHFWHESEMIQSPERPWELIQLGNCGAPLETEAGWLVITHGVGPMRQYALGALLLDLNDPSRVIGHLREPLLEPAADERDGYVPNVVYSCGSMISGEHLVLPYGFSDVGTRIATVRLDDLLGKLTGPR